MSHENAEAVQRLLAALNGGDEQVFLGLLAADANWQVADEHPESRTCHGIDEIRQYLDDWAAEVSDLRFEVEGLIEQGDRVVAVGRVHGVGVGSGLDLDVPLAIVHTVRNGQIVRVEEYLDPERALKAAGLPH